MWVRKKVRLSIQLKSFRGDDGLSFGFSNMIGERFTCIRFIALYGSAQLLVFVIIVVRG